MLEVVGDSARGEELAFVRLTVDGDRIVDADAPGLDRPLAGLKLLEAAAVPGETLAADALANALAQVFWAEPDPERIAVAMSGGVDSAVALLRAGPKAIGVTLRLWLDPEGPDSERACCSPEAVIAARETCHGLGLPHVTLDLREEFRRAVVEPFVQGYARGETPNPCGRCNGSFRFDELLAFAARAGAAKLWTGHYARIVERDGRRLLARAADPEKDQSYMLAQLDPEKLERIEFPLGELTKAETRAEAAAAGLEVAERRESQEACFLAGDDYRSFLERRGLDRSDGRDRRRGGPGARPARRRLALHARPAARDRGCRGRAAVRAAHRRSSNTLVVGPRGSLARTNVDGPASCMLRSSAPTRSSGTARQRSPRVSCRGRDGFALELDQPSYGVATGQLAVLYDEAGAVVGCGVVSAAPHH